MPRPGWEEVTAPEPIESRVGATARLASVPIMTGSLLSISIAGDYSAALDPVSEARLVADHGIEGDRYAGSVRQVTVVCTGEVESASADFGKAIDPFETRRNLVVHLEELPRTHGTKIRIGDAVLMVWRDCAPCEVMEEVFGEGAKEALRRRAGVSAQVETGGVVRLGDPVEILGNE